MVPTNAQSGLIAHIAETGNASGVDRISYMKESVAGVFELAKTRLSASKFDVAMFRGWQEDVDDKIDWGVNANNPAVASVTDVRERSLKHGDFSSFLFDPMNSTIYMPGHVFFNKDNDPDDAIFASQSSFSRHTGLGRTIEKSSLVVTGGAKPMPIYVFQ